MSTTQPPQLGTCPKCNTTLASLKVTLDVSAETPALYTDCPVCRETVNPD